MKSVVTGQRRASKPRPDSALTSVKVLLPLRQRIVRRRFAHPGPPWYGDVEIEIAVVVVIDEVPAAAAADADSFDDVFKIFSSAIIVKKADTIGETDGKISVAVVVRNHQPGAARPLPATSRPVLGDVGLAVAKLWSRRLVHRLSR